MYEYYRDMQEQKRQPRVWSKAMNTVNRECMTEEEKLAVENDQEERKKFQLAQSKAHLTQMLKTTGLSQNGEYVQDINGMRVDRRSQRVRKIFGEVVPSPSATVTEKLAAATYNARESSHAALKQSHVQFDTMPASTHSQNRFSQKPQST